MADWFTAASAFVGTLTALLTAGLWLRRQLRPHLQIWEDLRGEPPRPGVAGRPGAMERLAAHDTWLIDLQTQVQVLQGQLGTLIGRGMVPGPTTGSGHHD